MPPATSRVRSAGRRRPPANPRPNLDRPMGSPHGHRADQNHNERCTDVRPKRPAPEKPTPSSDQSYLIVTNKIEQRTVTARQADTRRSTTIDGATHPDRVGARWSGPSSQATPAGDARCVFLIDPLTTGSRGSAIPGACRASDCPAPPRAGRARNPSATREVERLSVVATGAWTGRHRRSRSPHHHPSERVGVVRRPVERPARGGTWRRPPGRGRAVVWSGSSWVRTASS